MAEQVTTTAAETATTKPATVRGTADGALIATAPPTPATPATPAPAAPETTEAPAAAPTVGRGGQMAPEAISERVARERRKVLREEYGTDDPKKISEIRAARKAEADEVKKLRDAEAERQRAALTEQQRLQADLERERERAAKLEAELTETRTQTQVEKQTAELRNIATRFVDADASDLALLHFQRHVQSLPVVEVKRLTPKAIERWFRKFAADHPKYARTDAPAATTPGPLPPKVAAPTPPARKVGLTSGARPTPRTAAKPAAAPPPAKPIMEMTKAELRAYQRARGLAPW